MSKANLRLPTRILIHFSSRYRETDKTVFEQSSYFKELLHQLSSILFNSDNPNLPHCEC